LSALGTSDQIKDSQDAARDFLWKAERIFDELEDVEGKAQCLNKIGVSYWRNGDIVAARRFFEDSLENAETDESKAIALLNIAMAESTLENHQKALEFSKLAYNFIGKVSYLTEAKIRNRTGNALEKLAVKATKETREKIIDLAILEFEGAILCYEKVGQERLASDTRNNIGYLYYSIGNYQSALNILQFAKTRAYQLKDKIHISTACDTLARVYIAIRDYDFALSNSSVAIKYLEENENSNRLSSYLCVHAIALSRSGRVDEARENFKKAEEVANYIGDRILIAQAQLFALRELFSEYEENNRASIFEDVRQKLSLSTDKDVVEAIEEIAGKLKIKIAAGTDNVAEKHFPKFLELPAEDQTLKSELEKTEKDLIEKERKIFADALRQTKGNKSRAAKVLGMIRQTMVARINKYHPGLFDSYETGSAKQNSVVKAFPSYLVPNVSRPESTIGLLNLKEDYLSIPAGNILLVEIGTWYFNHTVALRNFFTPNGPTLIGVIRNGELSFEIEQPDGRKFDFHNEQLIIGNVIGYCLKDEFEEFLEKQKVGVSVEIPLREIEEIKV